MSAPTDLISSNDTLQQFLITTKIRKNSFQKKIYSAVVMSAMIQRAQNALSMPSPTLNTPRIAIPSTISF
jgi:hypothetical protein